jgi:pyruvate kinase
VRVVAKIEKPEALENIDAILEAVDGLMVARGDLGVETPLERVPLAQKMLIAKANLAAKPVITATQMLRSMVQSPRPTRAEVADVANAIFDGTDAVMLSEETAVGQYPVQAVQVLDRVARATEDALPYEDLLRRKESYPERSIPEAVAHAAATMARDLNAALIAIPTSSGQTARLVSRYRPRAPILALSCHPETVRFLALCWGVVPVEVEEMDELEVLERRAMDEALRRGLARPGDRIVVTAGLPLREAGTTNLIRAVTAEAQP